MKKLIALIIVLAGATGLWAWYSRAGAASAATTQPTATTTVERGDIFQAVSATGRVVSNLDVDIKCQASGEIIELPFDVSSHVKKDDILVQLNPVDEQRSVDQATVALDSAQAKFDQATQNLEVAKQDVAVSQLRADANLLSARAKAKDASLKASRRKELLAQNLTSHEDYDTAEATAQQAEADVKSAEAAQADVAAQRAGLKVKEQDVAIAKASRDTAKIALDQAKQRKQYCTVVAPMDGVVSALNVQKGVIVASGTGGFSGGTTLMTLSDLSQIFVLASVDESDIGTVHMDSPCHITADAFPGKQFEGKVVRIATKGVNTSNVVTFEVKIEVTSRNKELLKPEMTTNVEIVSAQRDGVLLAPVQAISRKDRRMMTASVVLAGGKTEDRQVKVGISDGDNYEIVEGLNEGDTVVLHKDESGSKWNGGGGGSRRSSSVMGMGGGRRSGR